MSSEAFARDHYEREDIARIYGQWKDLLPAERVPLEIHRDRIEGRRVLDLGCGGGRTSPWLHALASYYLGLDYSSKLIELCRVRYPEFAFKQGNARNLVALGDASFNFVLLSYNCGLCLHAAEHAWLAH
jgi:ubiquinone/menaquinone biosynthesis C-methylase UbiE